MVTVIIYCHHLSCIRKRIERLKSPCLRATPGTITTSIAWPFRRFAIMPCGVWTCWRMSWPSSNDSTGRPGQCMKPSGPAVFLSCPVNTTGRVWARTMRGREQCFSGRFRISRPSSKVLLNLNNASMRLDSLPGFFEFKKMHIHFSKLDFLDCKVTAAKFGMTCPANNCERRRVFRMKCASSTYNPALPCQSGTTQSRQHRIRYCFCAVRQVNGHTVRRGGGARGRAATQGGGDEWATIRAVGAHLRASSLSSAC